MANKFIEKPQPEEQEVLVEENTSETVVEDNAKTEQTENSNKQEHKNTFWSILGGDFLTRKVFLKQFPLIILLFVYGIIFIAVSRVAESNIKKMTGLKKELKEYRNKQIYMESELMRRSKQTQIEQNLDSIGLKSSTTPVTLLYKGSKK